MKKILIFVMLLFIALCSCFSLGFTNITYNYNNTDTANWVNVGNYKSSKFNYNNSLLYFGISGGKFGAYNSYTNISTDLSGTDTGNWISTSGINALEMIPNKNLYLGIDSGKFGTYNTTSNVTTDLSATDTGGWLGTDAITGLTYNSNNGFLYLSANTGKLGWYNPITNIMTTLSATDTSNWIGTSNLFAIKYNVNNTLVYIGGDNGKFGGYNSTSNVTTDLSATDTGGFLTGNIRSLENFNNLIFIGANDGQFGVYNPITNIITNLSGTDTGNWFGTLNIMGIKNFNGLIFLSLSGGKYGYYNSYTNISTDLSGTDTLDFIGVNDISSIELNLNDYNIYLGVNLGYLGMYNFIDIINLTYPINSTIYTNNSLNVSYNYNGSIIINTLKNATCQVNNTKFNKISTSPNQTHLFINTTLPDGNYSIYANCSNNESLTFWFLYDTNAPTLTSLSLANNSNLAMDLQTLSFTASDNSAIWEIKTLINNSILIPLNETISGISLNSNVMVYNYSKVFVFSTKGIYSFNYTISDTHTDLDIIDKLAESKEIPYSFETENGFITTLDNTEFLIRYPKNLTITSVKTTDSINYLITNRDSKINTYYTIESTEPIKYLINSKYKCHFIINNLWNDCEGLNNVLVEKISDYKYKVNFYLAQDKSIIEKSTGILNSVSYTGTYNVVYDATGLNVNISVYNFNNNSINVNLNNTINLNNSIEFENTNYNYNNITLNVSVNNSLNINSTINLNVSVNNTLNNNNNNNNYNINYNNLSVNNSVNLNSTLNVTNNNNINLSTNYTININISNPSSSISTDTSISNIYMTFIFLFLIYVLMFIISFKLNTKIGLLMTFIVGIFLGVYFTNKISGVYSLAGIGFIIINAYFFLHTIVLKK